MSASVLAYDHINPRKARLAMRVGRHYKLDTIQPRHWADAAKDLKLPSDALTQRLRGFTTALPDAISDTSRVVERQRLRHPNLTRLRDELNRRAARIMDEIKHT